MLPVLDLYAFEQKFAVRVHPGNELLIEYQEGGEDTSTEANALATTTLFTAWLARVYHANIDSGLAHYRFVLRSSLVTPEVHGCCNSLEDLATVLGIFLEDVPHQHMNLGPQETVLILVNNATRNEARLIKCHAWAIACRSGQILWRVGNSSRMAKWLTYMGHSPCCGVAYCRIPFDFCNGLIPRKYAAELKSILVGTEQRSLNTLQDLRTTGCINSDRIPLQICSKTQEGERQEFFFLDE